MAKTIKFIKKQFTNNEVKKRRLSYNGDNNNTLNNMRNSMMRESKINLKEDINLML